MILAPLPWKRARALRSQGEGLIETGLPGRGGLSAPLECSSCGNGRVSELSLLGTGIWHLIFVQVLPLRRTIQALFPFRFFCWFALSVVPSLCLLDLLYLVFKEIRPW